jgi:hypothetical protein
MMIIATKNFATNWPYQGQVGTFGTGYHVFVDLLKPDLHVQPANQDMFHE